MLYSHQGMHLI